MGSTQLWESHMDPDQSSAQLDSTLLTHFISAQRSA